MQFLLKLKPHQIRFKARSKRKSVKENLSCISYLETAEVTFLGFNFQTKGTSVNDVTQLVLGRTDMNW